MLSLILFFSFFKVMEQMVFIRSLYRKSYSLIVSMQTAAQDLNQQSSVASCFSTRSSKDRNWSDLELYRLSFFMLYHIDKFKSEKERKESKIYSILSKYLRTRNANQCRNYVLKLFSKFRNYEKILNFLKESLPYFEEKYQQHENQLSKIIFPLKTISKQLKSMKADEIQIHNGLMQSENLIEEVFKETSPKQQQLKPTDIDYSDSMENQISKSNSHNVNSHKEKDRNSATERKPSLFDQSYFNSHFSNKDVELDNNWIECHQMYVEWASKTFNLLQKQVKRQLSPQTYCD